MRFPAEETAARHERILKEASRLFREHGLNGVSIPEIMKAAQLTHGPFYNHFASKEALVADSIDRAMGAMLQEILSYGRSKTARRQFLDAYLSPEHRDDPGDGCVMAALASDVARSPAAKVSFTKRFKDILSALSAKFTSARKNDARAEAIKLVATIVGGMILARAVDDAALSDEILAQLRAHL
jgi:TetR/AcrR family transcriptional regulator, transcriptional repressor for nem operon